MCVTARRRSELRYGARRLGAAVGPLLARAPVSGKIRLTLMPILLSFEVRTTRGQCGAGEELQSRWSALAMIARYSAVQFDRVSGTGRTTPGFVTCEDDDGRFVDAVVKISARCDVGVTSLAIELFSANVAAALGLPITEPILVEMSPEWIDTIHDPDWRAAARQSCPIAFGSTRAASGFGQWVPATSISTPLEQSAAGVLVFDALSDNADRRGENPNCLVRGDEIRIIDHEMCFPAMLFGWQPPWQIGGLQHLTDAGRHIFRDALHGRDIDWAHIVAAWKSLTDDHLEEMRADIPVEWADAAPAIGRAVEKIINARDHIEDCVIEVQRVLR